MKIIELKVGDVLKAGDLVLDKHDGRLFLLADTVVGEDIEEQWEARYYRIESDTEPVREESENIILYTAPGVCISIEKCVGCHDAAAFIGAIAVMLDNSVDAGTVLG